MIQSIENWLTKLNGGFEEAYNGFINILPSILTFILIVALGLIFSFFVKKLTKHLLKRTLTALSHVSQPQMKSSFSLSTWTVGLIPKVLYWVSLLFFLTAALHYYTGIEKFELGLKQFVYYMPNIFAAAVILFFGWFLSVYLQGLTIDFCVRQNVRHDAFISRVIKWSVLAVFFDLTLAQLGFDTSVLCGLILLTYGISISVLAFSFAYGSRPFFENVITAQALQKRYELGQKVRINNTEGIILKFTSTGVVLLSNKEETFVPARHFFESPSTLIT